MNSETQMLKGLGGQKRTWLKQIERKVKPLDFDLKQAIEEAIEQAQNREQWQGQIECIMH